jgi:hypothetical protein
VRVNVSTKFPFAWSIACLLCGCLLVAPLRITLLPPLLSCIARSCYKNWARLLVLWWNSFKFLLQSRLLLHSLGGFFSSGVDFVAHLMALPFYSSLPEMTNRPPTFNPPSHLHKHMMTCASDIQKTKSRWFRRETCQNAELRAAANNMSIQPRFADMMLWRRATSYWSSYRFVRWVTRPVMMATPLPPLLMDNKVHFDHQIKIIKTWLSM